MKSLISVFILMVLLACNTRKQDVDLVGYWPFDDATSKIVPDHSGNQLDAINKGAVLTDGKVGKALEFDGKSVLQIDYNTLLDSFRNGITISAWMKKDTATYWNTIVSREIKDGWSEYFGLAVFRNQALFSIDTDGIIYKNVMADELIDPGKWYHLAGTFDNENFKLYLNGDLIKSSLQTGPIIFNDKNPLLIGGNTNNQNQSLVDCFKGIIDEVRIYKRALTAEEIKNLAN